MKKKYNLSTINIIILIIIFLLNIFIFKLSNIYIFDLLLLVSLILMLINSNIEKKNYRNSKDVLFTIIIFYIIYNIIIYLFGIKIGFIKNIYSFKIINIIKNIFPILILIIIRERLRNLYLLKSNKSKLKLVLCVLMFILLDVNMYIKTYDIYTLKGIISILCLVVFPSLTKNIFLSYISYNYGYKNPIIYSCLMELKIYLFPFFPDLGDYIKTIFEITLPILLTLKIYSDSNQLELRKISYNKKNNRILEIIFIILILLIIILNSGLFKYYMLTIGSESMTPTINKGDIIMIKKLSKDNLNELKKNDIIAFKHDNKIIVHRLVNIKKMGDSYYYETKGDNNLTKDAYYVKSSEIVGTYMFRIRFLGYPTVSLSEKINRR